MTKGDIVVYSLVGSDYIIGKFDHESDNGYVINEPRRIQIMPKKDGFNLVFIPINIFADKDHIDSPIEIPSVNILRIDNKVQLRQDIMDNYIKHINGVPLDSDEAERIKTAQEKAQAAEVVNQEVVESENN